MAHKSTVQATRCQARSVSNGVRELNCGTLSIMSAVRDRGRRSAPPRPGSLSSSRSSYSRTMPGRTSGPPLWITPSHRIIGRNHEGVSSLPGNCRRRRDLAGFPAVSPLRQQGPLVCGPCWRSGLSENAISWGFLARRSLVESDLFFTPAAGHLTGCLCLTRNFTVSSAIT